MAGGLDEVVQAPERRRRRRRRALLAGLPERLLGRGEVGRIAERGRPGELGRQRRRLGLQRLEPLDILLELAERALGIVHHLLRRAAPRAGRAEPLALPAQHRGGDLARARRPPAGRRWRRSRRESRRTPTAHGGWRRRRRHAVGSGRRAGPDRCLRLSDAVPPRRSHRPARACSGAERLVAHRLEGDEPVERAEQLAHVVDGERGHGLEHALAEPGAALLGLPAEDGDAGLVVGRRDVDDEPAGEPADEPLVERLDLGGRPVAGEDDLAVGGLQRVGEPQQLRLHLAPVGEELHVVHQQQVDVEEPLAVGLAVPGGDGGVERLDELVEGEVLHGEPRVDRAGRMADGHQQVGLPQARAGVDEERVVHRPRRLGDRLGRGDRQAVGRPHHEGVEAVERVERDGHATGAPHRQPLEHQLRDAAQGLEHAAAVQRVGRIARAPRGN